MSVIVPVYNVEGELARCIDSLVAQTHANTEIILVNDGSTDASGMLCESYANTDPRIRVIHKENGGVSSARNAGLEVARGEFVSFVDSDDFVETDFLESLLRILTEYRADISSCAMATHPATELADAACDGTRVRVIEHSDGVIGTVRDTVLFASSCNRLFSRRTIEGLQFAPEMTFAEDQFFNFQAYLRANLAVHDAVPRYHYVAREESAMATRDRLNEDRLYALSKMRELASSSPASREIAINVEAREVMEYIKLMREIVRSPHLDEDGSRFFDYSKHLRTLTRNGLHNPTLGWKFKLSLGLVEISPHLLKFYLRAYSIHSNLVKYASGLPTPSRR